VQGLRKMIPINQPIIGEEEIELVKKVLKSGLLTEKSGCGYYVSQFEDAFAKYVGSKYAVAMSSGTAALHASLMAVGLRAGDEVVMPSFTFVAAAEAAIFAGGIPIFADIDPDTYCVNPESVEDQISSKTKAIIPVHLYGLSADMNPILKLAREHDFVVIEDAAQALGAEYKGKRAGSIGDIACFSFYATKNITTGEGGMVTTNNAEYAEILQEIRNHGEQKEYSSVRLGHNYRMPEVAAAIGLSQLSNLPRFLEARRKNAEILGERLSGLEKLGLPVEPYDRKHSWYVYTVRLKKSNVGKRNKLVAKLRSKRIGVAVYYPVPIHMMPYYKERYAYSKKVLKETMTATRQVFSLPVHPKITEGDLDFIATTLAEALK